MLLSRLRTFSFRRQLQDLALRLSWQQLPPLATHGAVFLLGTMLMRPHLPGQRSLPRQLLIPAEPWLSPSQQKAAIDGELVLTRGHGEQRCRIWEQPVRLWKAPLEGAPKFVSVPARASSLPLLNELFQDAKLQLVAPSEVTQVCVHEFGVEYD